MTTYQWQIVTIQKRWEGRDPKLNFHCFVSQGLLLVEFEEPLPQCLNRFHQVELPLLCFSRSAAGRVWGASLPVFVSFFPKTDST